MAMGLGPVWRLVRSQIGVGVGGGSGWEWVLPAWGKFGFIVCFLSLFLAFCLALLQIYGG
jgi:hypothetical protein